MSKTFTNKDVFGIREQVPAKEHEHAVAHALQTKSNKASDPRTSYKLHRSAMKHKALARVNEEKVGKKSLKMSSGEVRHFGSERKRDNFEGVARAVNHGWKPAGKLARKR